MFRPKKTIPKLAVAALALTGCGGDGGGGAAGMGGTGGTGGAGGTGGTGGGNGFDASLSAFCMNVDVPCWGYTMEECTSYYNDANNHNDNAQCTAALISYFDCASSKTCAEIFDYACYAEYTAIWHPDTGVCDELP
jgi:hypothetical protein